MTTSIKGYAKAYVIGAKADEYNALPYQQWVAYEALTGDASGGFMLIEFSMEKFGQDILWSLEELTVGKDTGSVSGLVAALGPVPGIAGGFYQAEALAEPDKVLSNNSYSRHQGFKRIFQHEATTYGRVQMYCDNVNLMSVVCYAWGYMWRRSALDTPGGPVRPLVPMEAKALDVTPGVRVETGQNSPGGVRISGGVGTEVRTSVTGTPVRRLLS